VKYYNTIDTSDHWKSHNPLYPTVNDLNTVDHKMGLWVHITSLGDGNLTVNGDYSNSTTINLKAGWNLVGYPAQSEKTVSASLSGTGYTQVEAYSSTSPYVQVMNDSDMMTPGNGYWVHVNSDTTWTIDW